jgi:putative DNA primase/helicase
MMFEEEKMNIPEENRKFIELNDKIKQDEEKEELKDKKYIVEKMLGVYPVYFDDAKNWWKWEENEFKWKLVDETDLLNMFREEARMKTWLANNKQQILELCRELGRRNKPKDIPKTWVQLKDKFWDIQTGLSYKVTFDWFASNPIPWEANKDKFEDTPTIDKLLKEWVGDKKVKMAYELMAYCLIPDYPIHRIFILYGSGCNGKSSYLKIIEKLLGLDNVAITELETLIRHPRFESTRLFKKLACMIGETNFETISATSLLKKLSDGSPISAEYKGAKLFHFHNYAKLILATNNLPVTTDKTVGFYRRIAILLFPNQFTEERDVIAEIPEKEYESLALKLISIANDLVRNRKFTDEESITDKMKTYERISNPVESFIAECCEETIEEDLFVSKFVFLNEYNKWAILNGHRSISKFNLGRIMTNLEYEEYNKRIPTPQKPDNRVRLWKDLALKIALRENLEYYTKF